MTGRQKVALVPALAIPLAEQGGLYQRPLRSSGGGGAALCDGGPSAASRDTALHDNLFEYFIAESGIAQRVTDPSGRLVGYTLTDTSSLGSLTLFVTCIGNS
jgi:hypothetical protein